jgi:hypothetical protein
MKSLSICLLFLALAANSAQAADSKNHRSVDPDTAYKNNCMRCHASTQQYSPRMTKTIIMHMRVRANLPEDQAQAILEYLNGNGESSRPVKTSKPNGTQGRQGGQ